MNEYKVTARKSGGVIIGTLIRGDNGTAAVRVVIPRYANGVDLAPLVWSVHVANASGAADVVIPAAVTADDASVMFEWLPGGVATAAAGMTDVHFEGVDEGALVWASATYHLRIDDKNDATPSGEDAQKLTELQQLIVFVRGELNGVIEAGRSAQEAANRANEAAERAENVAVDKTLKRPGAAADAAVVGEKIDGLSEEIADLGTVKAINGFTPDSSGDVTIKYDTTTGRAYRHEGLSKLPKRISVFSDERYTNNPHIFLGKNYWPAVAYTSGKYTQHGLTLETDMHNITVTGTATAGSSFRLTEEDHEAYWPLPEGIAVGDTVKLYLFGSRSDNTSPFIKVDVYNESKTRLTFKQIRLDAGSTFSQSSNLTIPEGAAYLMFHVAYSSGGVHDNTIFPVMVKTSTTIISDQAFTDGVVSVETEDATVDICTAPYESEVQYQLALKEYIDSKSNGASVDMAAVEGIMSFVSPEMFGAYADGLHDDTVAVQKCIDFAIENKKKVIGGGSYITSEPIRITGNYLSVDLTEIVYSGTDSAVIVNGSYNNISITRIDANKGRGFRLNSDIASGFSHYHIERIYSNGNCIEYIGTTGSMVGNNMTFGYLNSAGGANCIYQNNETDMPEGVYHNNNNFTGGKLAAGEWGVYNANGSDTYITCQFEGVKNGIRMQGTGSCRVVAPRYAELVRGALDYNTPGRPTLAGQGVLFKIVSPYSVWEHGMAAVMNFDLAPQGGHIFPANVDLTEASDIFAMSDGTTSLLGKDYPGAHTIRAKLISRHTNLFADDFMLFGKHILVKHPAETLYKHVTQTDRGYAGDYTVTGVDDEFFIYAGYIIDDAGCDYTLPPSYDQIAFNCFTVEQSEGTSCTFRDWRGTVIFNGASYGAGTYELRACKRDVTASDYYDNSNQVWTIRRINNNVVATMPNATV